MKEKFIYLYRIFPLIFLFACNDFETIEIYENGLKKLECEMNYGFKNGECIGYFPSGEIKFKAQYHNDTLHGKSIFFHKNGELNWEVEFNRGNKEGEISYFDKDGHIMQKSNFKNNLLDGLSYNYYKHGGLKSEMNYSKGQLHGEYFSYHKNDNLKIRANYQKGKMIDFCHFDNGGKLIDHLIKYEIGESNGNLKIRALNKSFAAFGLNVSAKNKDGTVKPIYEDISIEGEFVISVPMENKESKLYFKLFEIDSIKNESDKGIVRSMIEFEYEI